VTTTTLHKYQMTTTSFVYVSHVHDLCLDTMHQMTIAFIKLCQN